jgi:hypothetical protein
MISGMNLYFSSPEYGAILMGSPKMVKKPKKKK